MIALQAEISEDRLAAPGAIALRWLTRSCGQILRSLRGVRLALAVVAVLSLAPLHAEPVYPNSPQSNTLAGNDIFQHLAEGSGLASQVISSFAEGSDGFLWIGSQGGLQRWDGYRLWTYKTQLGNSSSLPDNLTQILHADPSGTLWVGTSSGGLASYDQHRDRFIRYQTSTNGQVPVNVLAIEDDGQGSLWIGSGTGLDHFNKDTKSFTHVQPTTGANAAIDVGSVQALLRSADGTLWIGTSQGLLRSSAGPGQGQVVEHVEMPESRRDAVSVNCLFKDWFGTLWIGTDHGVYLVERAGAQHPASELPSKRSIGGSVVAYRPSASRSLPSALLTSHIVTITSDRDGGIWIGTQEQGVFIVTPSTGAVRHVAHDPTQPTSLSDDWVEAIFLDRQGIMWVGSRHGVSYIDTTHRAVATFLGGESPGSTIRDSEVYSVFPRRDGSIWLGLSKHGIDILAPSGRRIAELPSASGTSSSETTNSLPQGTVGAIRESANGGLYIVTQHGLYLAEGADIPGVTNAGAPSAALRSFHPRLKRLPIGAEAAEGLFEVLPDRDAQGPRVPVARGIEWPLDLSILPASGPAVPARLRQPLTDPRIRVLLRGDRKCALDRHAEWPQPDRYVATGDIDTIIMPDAAESPGAWRRHDRNANLTDRKGRLWVGTFTGGINVLQGIDADRQSQGFTGLSTAFRTTM